MRLGKTFLAAALALCAVVASATAQDEAGNRVAVALAQGVATDLQPTASDLEYLDEAGKKALRESLVGYYSYRASGYLHRRAVFDWQLLSSRIIFATVLALVLTGIYFSWVQFRIGLIEAQRKAELVGQGRMEDAPDTPRGEVGPLGGKIKASLGGIEVVSPVLGVVILAISLAFFYLYLVYVYPIAELF